VSFDAAHQTHVDLTVEAIHSKLFLVFATILTNITVLRSFEFRLMRMCPHCQPRKSVLRNLELCSTLRTWYFVSWQFLFASTVLLKTVQTERVNTRQYSRVLKFFLAYRTLFCTRSHSIVVVADVYVLKVIRSQTTSLINVNVPAKKCANVGSP